jgi:hypothetical protein
MGITAITIENFKGIRDPVRIEFKPITLLFGPNSAGKSTIVQALHYAYEIFDRNNLDPGSTSIGGQSVDLGGFETLLYNHDLSRSVHLKLELDLTNEDLPQYFEGYEDIGTDRFSYENIWAIPARVNKACVEVTIKWSSQIGAPLLNSYKVNANGEDLAQMETSEDGKQVFLTKINPLNPVFLEDISPDQAREIVRRMLLEKELTDGEFEKLGPIFPALMTNFNMDKGVAGLTDPIGIMAKGTALPAFGKPLEFQRGVWTEETDILSQGNFAMCMSSLIVGPVELIRDDLHRLSYIGPIREIPSRNFSPEKSPDPSRWSSGAMGWDILHRSDTVFIDRLNQWLTHQDRFNCGYRVEVNKFREIDIDDPIMLLMSEGIGLEEMEMIQSRTNEIPIKSRVAIREESTGIKLMPQDIGVGISQSLPIVVAALYLKEGILAIEQPELHIHPALQVAMGDLFISQIQEKALCFLLETHSEHLMLRFLRRIRETDEDELPPDKIPLQPEQLAVYFIEQSSEGITATPIRISKEGEFIDKWPKGFFSERMEELF